MQNPTEDAKKYRFLKGSNLYKGKYFERIQYPEHLMEGNKICANRKFIAVSVLTVFLLMFACRYLGKLEEGLWWSNPPISQSLLVWTMPSCMGTRIGSRT